ncbi:hypothetical protein SPHINGOR109_10639 [Sphingorhabdus sp. 109]|nr:hypothetical protein SPHINGOR109_10639 [Sphingorhabdus sp. 109]
MARGGEQIDCIEPKLQWRPALFKRSAHSRVQVMTAPLAGISALGFDPIPVGSLFALWAFVALSKTNIKDMLQAGFIIGKLLKELSDRERFLFHVHYVADLTTYGKGIITSRLTSPVLFLNCSLFVPRTGHWTCSRKSNMNSSVSSMTG